MSKAKSYFQYLDSRIRHISGSKMTVCISLYGYVAELNFLGIEPGREIISNLDLLLLTDSNAVQEKVYIWEDDLDELSGESMIPRKDQGRHYHQTDEYQILFPGMTKRLALRDNISKTTYVIFERGSAFPISYINKPFVNEIQWWLWDNYYLIHGAAVGADGCGALITSPSGKGKSTLALSCLAMGMDYVADDYVLISSKGPIKAYPLFNTGYLTPESMKLLPEYSDHVLMYSQTKNKYLLDLTPYRSCFREGLDLNMIIYPNLSMDKEPVIERAKAVPPFIAAMTSTARQIKSRHFFNDSFMHLFNRLKGLPAYEMRMCPDPYENARVLKKFLIDNKTRYEQKN